MDAITTSRTQRGKQQGLEGEDLLCFVGTESLFPEDPPIDEANLMDYSVKSFLRYLALSAQETQFIEEQSFLFCSQHDVSYSNFILSLLHKKAEQEKSRMNRRQESEKRRRDSIRRIQQPANIYKKVVDTSITKYGMEPKKRQHRPSSRGSTIPRNVDSGKETGGQNSIQVLTCERFWKLVDSMYFRRLPRFSEVCHQRVQNTVSMDETEEVSSKELFVWRGPDEASGKRRRVK